MIHPDDYLNDDNYSQLDEDVEIEINNSKDKDKLHNLWQSKCKLRKEQQNKLQHQKTLLNQRNQINEKLTTTMTDCNLLNTHIDNFEKVKWKKIYEK